MNNYFINVAKALVLRPSTVSNTNDNDEITKHFDGHISERRPVVKFYQKIILILKWFPWTKPRNKF